MRRPSTSNADLLAEPTVKHRLLQLRRGRRAEIQASDVLDSVPLLVNSGRELGGRTYHDAQAIYALRVDPQPDQTVGIELTPELHHGQSRVRWTGGDDGILAPGPVARPRGIRSDADERATGARRNAGA